MLVWYRSTVLYMEYIIIIHEVQFFVKKLFLTLLPTAAVLAERDIIVVAGRGTPAGMRVWGAREGNRTRGTQRNQVAKDTNI